MQVCPAVWSIVEKKIKVKVEILKNFQKFYIVTSNPIFYLIRLRTLHDTTHSVLSGLIHTPTVLSIADKNKKFHGEKTKK